MDKEELGGTHLRSTLPSGSYGRVAITDDGEFRKAEQNVVEIATCMARALFRN